MMNQVLGIAGVTLLLAAFVLNMTKKLTESSASYLWMNVVGAALAAVYAWESGTLPFVVLESIWGLAALARVFGLTKKASV